MTITGSCPKATPAEGYTIPDLSKPTDFLSMQIHYNHEHKSIKIYQGKYI